MNGVPDSGGGTVVVTGATGFLGSHVADLLLARGRAVRASVRPTSDRRWLDPRVEVREAVLAPAPGLPDDADAGTLDALLDGASAVVHCAGLVRAPDEAGYRRANVLATRRLLDAAARAGTVRAFVLISSLAASGPSTPGRPRRESDTCAPVTAYGLSKLAAERLLDDARPFRTAILRPPALYGPRDRAFLPLLRAARRGWTVRLGRIAAVSLVDGRDAAAAAAHLLDDARATGPWFVDDGRAYTNADLAAALGRVCGRRVRSFLLPLWLLRTLAALIGGGRAARLPVLSTDRLIDAAQTGWVCDGARLRDELGFAGARGLEQGLRETLASYLAEGWLDAT